MKGAPLGRQPKNSGGKMAVRGQSCSCNKPCRNSTAADDGLNLPGMDMLSISCCLMSADVPTLLDPSGLAGRNTWRRQLQMDSLTKIKRPSTQGHIGRGACISHGAAHMWCMSIFCYNPCLSNSVAVSTAIPGTDMLSSSFWLMGSASVKVAMRAVMQIVRSKREEEQGM